MPAGHQGVAGAQQGEQHGGHGRHAGGEAHRAHAVLKPRQLGLEGGRGRRALAGVVVGALESPLVHRDQVLDPLVSVLPRRMDGLVHSKALHDSDPYADIDHARRCARAWGSRIVEAGNVGHINASSSLGDWAQGRALLQELL